MLKLAHSRSKTPDTSPSWFGPALGFVVLLAAVLRLWSIDFGVPLVTHPDEPLIFTAADRMISERTLNPGWFRYPAFIIDIEAGVLVVVYAVDRLFGLSADAITTTAYTAGRLIMATLGILTVLLTGLLGRRVATSMSGRGGSGGAPLQWSHRPEAADEATRAARAAIAGIVAALLLAVSFVHVKDSHYLKPDAPTGFFCALVLWLSLDALEQSDDRRLRRWLLAAAAVGLAAAAKYTGAVVAVVPATAILLAWRREHSAVPSFRRVILIAAAMGATAVAVFLLINPGIVMTPRDFLSPVDGIRAEMNHYRTGHDGAEGSDTWRWYFGEIWRSGFGPTLTPIVLLGALAAVGALVRRRASGALLLTLVFPPVYYLTIAPYPVRFDRQLIPLLPYLAILGGLGVAVVAGWVAARRPSHRAGLAPMAALAIVALLAVAPMADAARWDHVTGLPDTRYAALDWIEAHVPRGTVVVREWHTPPVGQAGYGDVFIRKANDESLEWYRATGADYLVLSSYMYQRFLDAPDRYPSDAAFYARLLAAPRQATFSGRNGPTIVVLRIDEVATVLPQAGRSP